MHKTLFAAAMAVVGSVFALTAHATDYYWNPTVTSGNWSCTNSWCSDATCTKVATSYPKSSADQAHFVANTTAAITMTEKISIKGMDLGAAGLNLTFTGTSDTSLYLSNGSGYTSVGANVSLTIDGFTFTRIGGWTFADGASLTVENSTFTVGALTLPGDGTANFTNGKLSLASLTLKTGNSGGGAQCYMTDATVTMSGSYAPEAGTTFELNRTTISMGGSSVNCACFFTLKGGTKATFTGNYTGGSGATVTIDDSMIQWNGLVYLNSGTGCEHYIFKGNNPKVVCKSNYFRTIDKQGKGMNFDFEVPVGGFAEPPIQDYNAWSYKWLSSSCANTKAYVNILETSPALLSTEYVTDCPLAYSPYGMLRSYVACNVANSRYASLDGQTAANDDATAKALYVTLGTGTTPAKPDVGYSAGLYRAKVTVSRRTLTFATDVTALATTGTTRARYLVGETKGDLAEVSSTEVTAVGEVTFAWTAPVGKLNNTYYVQVVLETLDGDGQVTHSESSSIVSATTQDTTVYTWQAVDGEWDGVWSDRAHWATDTGDDRYDYPQTTSCSMAFPADHAVTITVDRALTIGKLKLNKTGIDVTLVNAVEDRTKNKMTGYISSEGTYAASLTFKYLEYKNSDNLNATYGKKIRFENSYFWMDGYYSAIGTTELYLKDSTSKIGSYITLGGGGSETTQSITLDNSQMTVGGNICPNTSKYGRIVFKGKNPKLYSSAKDKGFFSELDYGNGIFEFEIPEGGFSEVPICGVSGKSVKAFVNSKSKQPPDFNFVILPTSPALWTPGDTRYPLMTWDGGITKDRATFDGVVSATDTFLYGDMNTEGYDWQPVATSELGNPTAIGVKIHGLNSTDIVTVQGYPGNFGTASPVYGATTGHVVGETATYSVPEPIFESEGVNYSVTGYVVSNVLADLTYQFVYEGAESSFEYTHPANHSTVVTWLWGRSFALTVNAGEGGSVSPEPGVYAEGEIVEVTATPADGYAFYKWSGDTAGIDDVAKAKVSVTMDRARTLTATFGHLYSVSTDDGLVAAVAAAVDNDVIELAAGEYQLTNTVAISKGVTFKGATGNPEDVIVYGGKNLSKAGISFTPFKLDNKNALLCDLTVAKGTFSGSYVGGGAVVYAGTIRNCIFRECSVTYKHSGPILYATGSDSLLSHCVVTNNSVSRYADSDNERGTFLTVEEGAKGYDILVADNKNTCDFRGTVVNVSGASVLANATVVNNSITGTKSGNIPTAGIYTSGKAQVINCLVAGNSTSASEPAYACWRGVASAYKNCVFDKFAPNDTCVVSDPGLKKPAAGGDYHLTAASVAVNFGVDYEGMEATDLDGNPRKSGSAVDAGCYEYDLNVFSAGFSADVTSGFAPLTVTFTPTLTGVSEGDELELSWDFNGDGVWDKVVNTADPVENEFGLGKHTIVLKAVNKTTSKEAPVIEMADLITVGAKILYVNQSNTEGTEYPYDTEAKAATNIQTAIDAALPGAEILLADDVYDLAKTITVDKEVCLAPKSGKRGAVIIRGKWKDEKKSTTSVDDLLNAWGCNLKLLNMNAGVGALVHSIIFQDAFTASDTGAIEISAKGGVFSNCVVRSCLGGDKWGYCAGVYASGANAIVTHSILTNNLDAIGTDQAHVNASALVLVDGARCEHSLIAYNRQGGSRKPGFGPSQNTIHMEANTRLRFCTVVSNDACFVAGVNVGADSARVEYCVIAGNHSRHGDKIAYDGQQSTVATNASAEQVNRWHVWGSVGEHKSDADGDMYVVTNELKAATAARAAAFVNCATDTVKPNDSGIQAPVGEFFRKWENGKVVPSKSSPTVDLLDPAQFSLPSVDVYGKPRVQGKDHMWVDLGAIETRKGYGTLMLMR